MMSTLRRSLSCGVLGLVVAGMGTANAGFTTHILQLSRDESHSVLQHLFRHIEKNLAFQVRVHWEAGTVLYWDNWATQHHAVWDYFPEERWGERVSAVLDHGPQA